MWSSSSHKAACGRPRAAWRARGTPGPVPLVVPEVEVLRSGACAGAAAESACAFAGLLRLFYSSGRFLKEFVGVEF